MCNKPDERPELGTLSQRVVGEQELTSVWEAKLTEGVVGLERDKGGDGQAWTDARKETLERKGQWTYF